MKVLNHIWFNPGATFQTIGIVYGTGDDGKPRAYIGVGNGLSEDEDIKEVPEWGAKFPIEAAKVLLGVK